MRAGAVDIFFRFIPGFVYSRVIQRLVSVLVKNYI